MGFYTTLIFILLVFIAVISRRIYATISDLETQISSLQTQLTILQNAHRDAEVEKEPIKTDLEKLRTQIGKWRERDQEEKLTLIGSISIVSEQIENDRQRALETQSLCASEAAERREMAYKRIKGVKKHMSMGGLNMQEERERRRRELENKVHPVLKARYSKLGRGCGLMNRMDGLGSDGGDASYMGGSDGDAGDDESGGSNGSSTDSSSLLLGRSFTRRPAMLFG